MSDTQVIVVRPPSNGIQRQEFGAQQSQQLAETASTAVAAQARAAIESRYVMAMRNPRDMDHVRALLLKECRRPSFAAVARYRKPIGAGIEGLSIRFVEAAFRCMGNVLPESMVIYEDDVKRIVRVQVTDLEVNLTYTRDVVVDKTVERKTIKDGQRTFGKRINSRGEVTHLVEATDDELLNKQAALESKAIRALGLRLVPGDLQDECEALVMAIKAAKITEDPDAERKNLIDGFAKLNILPKHLAEYLGHELEMTTPAEIGELRDVWVALRDGEANWVETVAHKKAQRAEVEGAAPATAAPAATKGNAGAKAKIAAAKGKAEPPAAETAPPVAAKAAEPVDDFAAAIANIRTRLERVGQTNDLVDILDKIAALPPGPDKQVLEQLAAQCVPD